jgi:hypothetical protein
VLVSVSARHHNCTSRAQNEGRENRMNTRKMGPAPQRKQPNAFQAGCREFESRPPLPENSITTRKRGRSC